MDVTSIKSKQLLICAFFLPLLLNGCLMNETVETQAAGAPGGAVNNPPVISGTPPRVVKVGVNYSFTPSAADADADQLSFLIDNQPSWTEFDAATGNLTGVPFLGSEGTYNDIVISVFDGTDTTSLAAFSITVEPATAANMPPEISGNPPNSVVAGSTYSFVPTASDPDGNTLTFGLQGAPAWLTVSPTTGVVTGMPQSGDVGNHSGIVLYADDGQARTELPPFSITVEPAPANNRPPALSGNPPDSVVVGSTYTFEPTASDPDGDTLTFGLQGAPTWLTVDPTTGAVTGMPQSGDVGSHTGIILYADDGQARTELPPFSILVSDQVRTGSVTLSWTPPTLNTDGSTLTDLAGYRIYYGTSPGIYTEEPIVLNNPGLSSYVVGNLTAGTWYFVSTAVNAQGIESDRSNMATKVVTP